MLLLEKSWDELRNIYQASLSSRLGYIHEDHLLKTISDARSGKVAPIVRVLWTISLEYWLRDLTARGLLYPRAASSSLFGQQVPISVEPEPATPFRPAVSGTEYQ